MPRGLKLGFPSLLFPRSSLVLPGLSETLPVLAALGGGVRQGGGSQRGGGTTLEVSIVFSFQETHPVNV